MKNENKPVEAKSESEPGFEKDSLGIDVKKSPWFIFAMLQIPIVIIMVIFMYIMSQQSTFNN